MCESSYLALPPSPPIPRILIPNLRHPDTTPSTAFHHTELLNNASRSLRARGGHSSIHRERRWDTIRYEIRVTAYDSGVGGEEFIVGGGGGCDGNCKEKVSHS